MSKAEVTIHLIGAMLWMTIGSHVRFMPSCLPRSHFYSKILEIAMEKLSDVTLFHFLPFSAPFRSPKNKTHLIVV